MEEMVAATGIGRQRVCKWVVGVIDDCELNYHVNIINAVVYADIRLISGRYLHNGVIAPSWHLICFIY